MSSQEVQRSLFQKMPDEDQDSLREFLKDIFRACERIYSSRVVHEAYTEWGIEKDIEREMLEQAIQEEDDF